jgi:hypothetical protein
MAPDDGPRDESDRSSRRDPATSPMRQDHIEQQDRQRDELAHAADYQIGPDDQRPDEARQDRTGTARRAEEASGRSPDENNQKDAERAYRESGGR